MSAGKYLRCLWRDTTFPVLRFAVHRIQIGGSATPFLLRLARLGWGNYFYSADVSYLAAVCRAAGEASESILECGSGLTTVLLGLIGDRRGIVVHTLENQPEWAERAATLLNSLGIRSVRIHCAPLRDYGAFQWYDVPEDLPPAFDLVVCDGPRMRTTRGGRYGLLPVMYRHITARTVVLMDDVKRTQEQEIIERWQREFPLGWSQAAFADGEFAILRHGDCGGSLAPGGRTL